PRRSSDLAALDAKITLRVEKIGGCNHALGFLAVVDQKEVAGHTNNGAAMRRGPGSLAPAFTFAGGRGGALRSDAAVAFELIENVDRKSTRRLFTLFPR